ncbi:UDP-glucose/GDP-mannose dehydrogenase family protein [Candidatus Gracilibacteria bacterium]|nr:UDP-glucose/GDP-mannose dehydrogenase family protein [Candidatus Gracilibacteria bacterium]
MKISIFGTGYVGLVTGACLAEIGHEVLCIDIDQHKIDDLKKGIIPIYEPGLEELVIRNYNNKRLDFSTDAKQGIEFGKAVFSAVGTPPDKNHKADLKFVKIVAETFGKYADMYKVFINKSTVPVGTGQVCKDIIQNELDKRGIFSSGDEEKISEKQMMFSLVSNPEFLREGTAVKDFMTPERIVCGVESEMAKEIMKKIYKPLTRSYSNIIFTDIASSEVSKYAANAFLATKLSFINEIANFSERVGADITDISKILGADSRIGAKFLHAGIGYGGSCFPKDVQALIETGKEQNYDFQIIKATESVNQKQKIKLVKKLQEKYPNLKDAKIALWGLSFKPKTDDIRDAPSLDIIQRLLDLGVSEIRVYDPISMNHVKKYFEQEKNIFYAETALDALKNTDALLIATEWDEFRSVSFEKIHKTMKGNLVIDGRNIFDKQENTHAVEYISIGR